MEGSHTYFMQAFKSNSEACNTSDALCRPSPTMRLQELRSLSPKANFTDRVTAACRRS
jgi:hypothetical protein